jgi:serine/threonine protein kinase
MTHEQPETVLATQVEASRPTIKSDTDALGEAVGQTLGRYKLLEKVGEGGCGVVYVAEQTEPVRRRVALKVIKLGMDNKAAVARFEAERIRPTIAVRACTIRSSPSRIRSHSI